MTAKAPPHDAPTSFPVRARCVLVGDVFAVSGCPIDYVVVALDDAPHMANFAFVHNSRTGRQSRVQCARLLAEYLLVGTNGTRRAHRELLKVLASKVTLAKEGSQ